MPAIFISYRRSDSQDVTGRIYDRLVARFSHKAVFKDVDNIPLGVAFPLHIQRMLGKANVVLVIIGPTWVTATDEQGRRRLDEPNDFVRVEVETALHSKMPVIPILVSGARMPAATELPQSLQGMVSRNGTLIRADPDFNHDIARLISGLEHLEKLLHAKKKKEDKEVIPTAVPVMEAVVVGELSPALDSKQTLRHPRVSTRDTMAPTLKQTLPGVAPGGGAQTEPPPRPTPRALWPWLVGGGAALLLGIVLIVALLATGPGAGPSGGTDTPDPKLNPSFGDVTLKADFEPDPFTKDLVAGGSIRTSLGGVNAWVSKKPDFRLNYQAGKYVLTIHVESNEDTTLLIKLPDGGWIANDDGPNNGRNPLIRFDPPKSGRYDIWVGTVKNGVAPSAKLLITEKKLHR